MKPNSKKREKKPFKLIAATKNRGKLEEIAKILEQFPVEVVSMEQIGIKDDIEETGTTFEENALIKARSIWEATGGMVLADDSGLEVDCLGGAPGIYSARYAGEGATDADKNRKLLNELKEVPADKRTARFVCAIAICFPDGGSLTVRGTCEGYIATEPAGGNGFGYDPLFYVPEFGMTIAQMDSDLKNRISHRGNALRQLVDQLERILPDGAAK